MGQNVPEKRLSGQLKLLGLRIARNNRLQLNPDEGRGIFCTQKTSKFLNFHLGFFLLPSLIPFLLSDSNGSSWTDCSTMWHLRNCPCFHHTVMRIEGHTRGRRGGTIDASRQDGKRSLLNEYHGLEIITHVYLFFFKLPYITKSDPTALKQFSQRTACRSFLEER